MFATEFKQVKFIERQKLTRLEKSIKRQIHQLESSQSTSSNNEQQIAELQKQLQSIAIDQLYISFYPTNLKYIALFTGNNGYERVVDIDNKSKLKRKSVWDCIRKSLVDELNEKKKIEEGKGEDGNESDGDSSSVPSSDSDDSDSDDEVETTKNTNNKKKIQLSNIKSWVNIEAAKQALLSMPEDTYPNATASSSVSTGQTIPSITKKNKNEKNKASSANDKSAEKKKDDRFAMSKELDGLFTESTTGEDYQKELIKSKNEEEDSSSSSDSESSDSSSDEEDDADPLKGLDGKKKGAMPASSIQQKSTTKTDDNSSSSSSSSSSKDSSDSSSSSDSSDSEDEKPTALLSKPNNVPEEDDDESSAAASMEDGEDDFFTSNTKISTEDIFTQDHQILLSSEKVDL